MGAHGNVQLVGGLLVLLLVVPLLVSSPLLLQLRRDTGRRRRGGGSTGSVWPASGGPSQATAPRAGTSTGCLPDGGRPVVPDPLALRAALSRTTAPGCSGTGLAARLGTATPPGTRTTAAERAERCYPHEPDPRNPRRCCRCGAALVVF